MHCHGIVHNSTGATFSLQCKYKESNSIHKAKDQRKEVVNIYNEDFDSDPGRRPDDSCALLGRDNFAKCYRDLNKKNKFLLLSASSGLRTKIAVEEFIDHRAKKK